MSLEIKMFFNYRKMFFAKNCKNRKMFAVFCPSYFPVYSKIT